MHFFGKAHALFALKAPTDLKAFLEFLLLITLANATSSLLISELVCRHLSIQESEAL